MSQGSFSFSTPTKSQQSFQFESASKRKRQAEGGVGTQVGGNKAALAQFIPGRGAELAWTEQNLLKPIKFKSGESPGPSSVSAFGAESRLFKGQKISIGFAFKAILDASLVAENDNIPTRFYVHNVYRHTKAEVCGVSTNQGSAAGGETQYNKFHTLWNTTLGPDASYIRRAPDPTGVVPFTSGGSCYAPATGPGSAVGAGLSANIVSPFRYPQNGEMMFSRLTRQNLENFMWNSHPMKIAYVQPTVNNDFGLTMTALAVLDNSPADGYGQGSQSMPHQQQNTLSSFDTPITPLNNSGCYYRCQSGQGKLAYHFNNDGTSPLVIDVVVTRIKKGHEVALGNGGFSTAYQSGYMNMTIANKGQQNYFGQPPAALDTFNNARVPFMAAKCLDYAIPDVQIASTDQYPAKDRPFRQVARDQFVISGGSTRPWSMDLQSLNYRANEYAQVPEIWNTAESPENPSQSVFTKNADDLTYVVSFGFSTLAIPLMEYGAATLAVIDRVPQSVNCSVTGVYTETPLPVYLSSDLKTPYVNGALDYVWFTDQLPPQLAGIDIANAGNVIRSQSSTSAYINVGPTNTQPAA
jgi:hypothetical protein